MSRVFGLMLIGWMAIGLTGCVGPRGAGCRGVAGSNGFSQGCDKGCGDTSCRGCDSCTGCGELYIDPWINHPADCVDPCDSCGNYNGQSCGQCRSVFSGFKSLWGYRCGCDPGPIVMSNRSFAPSCSNDCGGCDACMGEPACGCEGACDCGGYEPACGCEGACDCVGVEPGCGFEPGCGCEGTCDCGGHSGMSPHDLPSGEYIIESPGQFSPPVAAKPYQPRRTRKIFNPRTETARGFLNEYRR